MFIIAYFSNVTLSIFYLYASISFDYTKTDWYESGYFLYILYFICNSLILTFILGTKIKAICLVIFSVTFFIITLWELVEAAKYLAFEYPIESLYIFLGQLSILLILGALLLFSSIISFREFRGRHT